MVQSNQTAGYDHEHGAIAGRLAEHHSMQESQLQASCSKHVCAGLFSHLLATAAKARTTPTYAALSHQEYFQNRLELSNLELHSSPNTIWNVLMR